MKSHFSAVFLPALPVALLALCLQTRADTLLTSDFDANTGAHVFADKTDNVTGSATLTINDWTTHASVTSISDLTAISDDGGGFAQTQGGAGTYANPDVAYISRNHNQSGTRRGYSLTFEVNTTWDLTTLTIATRHTNDAGTQAQTGATDLNYSLSGGSLGAPVAASVNQVYYATPGGYTDVPFDLTGTSLGAGTYTLEIWQQDLTGPGGAYATYDGLTLEATIPSYVIFTSSFDANTGAAVLPGNTDDTSGAATLGVTWIQRASVTALSDLTAISDGNGGTLGGFAQLQGGAATYANSDNVYLSRNHNLDPDRSTSKRGFSFTFTVDSSIDLGRLTVYSGHTNNVGNMDQAFASDLVYSLSGTSLTSPVTGSSTEDYSQAPDYHPVAFDLSGTTIGAGTYTIEIYQTNMDGTGAYAMYDGVSLDDASALQTSLKVIRAEFNEAAFEVEVTGLNTSKDYVLKRSENLQDGFLTQIGDPVTPTGTTETFSDPAPAGTEGYYRVEEAP